MRHARGCGGASVPVCDSLDRERFRAFPQAGPVPAAPPGWTWQSLMELALAEAGKAAEFGDVPVGALVVTNSGTILSIAANRVERGADPSGHAEILALRAAAKKVASPRLAGCVLVCSLEPCLMCLGAITHARIDGLAYGAADARAGAVISAADAADLCFFNKNFWHMGGIMAERSAELLRGFFAKRR